MLCTEKADHVQKQKSVAEYHSMERARPCLSFCLWHSSAEEVLDVYLLFFMRRILSLLFTTVCRLSAYLLNPSTRVQRYQDC